MSEEFINYLKYIGFVDDNSLSFFISLYNSNIELQEKNNLKDANKNIIINTMTQYIKSLEDNQLLEMMLRMYERYKENKIKIESKKLLNIIKIYHNKDLKFYLIYWNKLSQYLMHRDIQKYQMQVITKKNSENKSINNSNFIKGDYLESMTVSNNINNKNNFIPNNISMIKVRNSDQYNNNFNIKNKPRMASKDFIQRQEKFMELKKMNYMKNMDENEKEFQLLYTFKPCLEESTKSFYYFNNNNSGIGSKKKRNTNLYNNKIHDLKMRNLRKVVDNERGLTFKPKINSNKNLSNMLKRNNF
jgi:hypothetical protein